MKSDIKEAVMVYEKARMYAYLSAEITSLYHEAHILSSIWNNGRIFSVEKLLPFLVKQTLVFRPSPCFR